MEERTDGRPGIQPGVVLVEEAVEGFPQCRAFPKATVVGGWVGGWVDREATWVAKECCTLG